MNVRIIPCAVCRTAVGTESIRPTTENAPELLSHPAAWFAILRTPSDPPQIGMLVCCSRKCAEHLASGTPVIASTPIGSA